MNKTVSAHHPQPSKPPVSARKASANRANAQRSTGPRTAKGKATSSLNALRHGILASYYHASDHVAIAEFLVHEATFVISNMQINAVKYLSQLLPLLRSILTNPLGAAYPPLLVAATELLGSLILHCKPRIATTWWVECLRMCVGCWAMIRVDLPESNPVQPNLVTVVRSLRDVVGHEKFQEAADALIKEDEELKDLLYPA